MAMWFAIFLFLWALVTGFLLFVVMVDFVSMQDPIEARHTRAGEPFSYATERSTFFSDGGESR